MLPFVTKCYQPFTHDDDKRPAAPQKIEKKKERCTAEN